MELAHPNLIEELLADVRGGRKKKPAEDAQFSTVYQGSTAKHRRKTCECGACASCTENARWERIFQTKFADPNYDRLSQKCGSSLNFIR
jgi:hypothetical protein